MRKSEKFFKILVYDIYLCINPQIYKLATNLQMNEV